MIQADGMKMRSRAIRCNKIQLSRKFPYLWIPVLVQQYSSAALHEILAKFSLHNMANHSVLANEALTNTLEPSFSNRSKRNLKACWRSLLEQLNCGTDPFVCPIHGLCLKGR
uniref:Uncharacterized protein MANES_10G059000 n=1 Tax=Rhizophora mucronata TaxID=61149 RepID=A0A2P2M4D8_RHIMU